MELLTRYIDEKDWGKTDLEKEESYIRTFYPDLEKIKDRLRHGEIIACSIKLFQIDNLAG